MASSTFPALILTTSSSWARGSDFIIISQTLNQVAPQSFMQTDINFLFAHNAEREQQAHTKKQEIETIQQHGPQKSLFHGPLKYTASQPKGARQMNPDVHAGGRHSVWRSAPSRCCRSSARSSPTSRPRRRRCGGLRRQRGRQRGRLAVRDEGCAAGGGDVPRRQRQRRQRHHQGDRRVLGRTRCASRRTSEHATMRSLTAEERGLLLLGLGGRSESGMLSSPRMPLKGPGA